MLNPATSICLTLPALSFSIKIGEALWSNDYTKDSSSKETRFVHELGHEFDFSKNVSALNGKGSFSYSLGNADFLQTWGSYNKEQRAEIIAGAFSVWSGAKIGSRYNVGIPTSELGNLVRSWDQYMKSITGKNADGLY